jgi:hypothetical protein
MSEFNRNSTIPSVFSAFFTVLCVVLLTGCGSGDSRREITEVRENPDVPLPPALSTAERLGMQAAPPESPHASAIPGMAGPGSAGPGGSGWTYEVPESWVQGPDRPMRVATFFVDAEGASECYVAVLTGAAGGIEANINRWREMMRQPPLPPEEMAGLPKIPMLDSEAAYVEIRGEYAGMAGMSGPSDPVPGQMMLGAICSLAESTVFVRMTGPEETILGEIDRFKQFCASLKQETM